VEVKVLNSLAYSLAIARGWNSKSNSVSVLKEIEFKENSWDKEASVRETISYRTDQEERNGKRIL